MRDGNRGPGGARIHVDAVRVRIPGRSAADGRRFAAELSTAFSETASGLLVPDGTVSLDGLRLSIRPPRTGSLATSTSAAIVRAIARGGSARRRT